jgi:hypothetical protein
MDRILDAVEYKPHNGYELNAEKGWGRVARMCTTWDQDIEYLDKCLDRPPSLSILRTQQDRLERVHNVARGVVEFGRGNGTLQRGVTCPYAGCDVWVPSIMKLRHSGAWVDLTSQHLLPIFDTFVCFESLQFMVSPSELFDVAPLRCWLLVTLPIVPAWIRLTAWRHWHPGQYQRYFHHFGLCEFLGEHGFRLKHRESIAAKIGRPDMWAYTFYRDLGNQG